MLSAAQATGGGHIRDRLPTVSFVTPAELWRGAFERGYGDKRRQDVSEIIDTLVVVPSTAELAEEWGRVVAEAKRAGHALGAIELGEARHANDAWIAATARLHDLPLLTGNRRHFEGLPGLSLIDA
jgi:tRNA(fMet)-specific endonuclease VapC